MGSAGECVLFGCYICLDFVFALLVSWFAWRALLWFMVGGRLLFYLLAMSLYCGEVSAGVDCFTVIIAG